MAFCGLTFLSKPYRRGTSFFLTRIVGPAKTSLIEDIGATRMLEVKPRMLFEDGVSVVEVKPHIWLRTSADRTTALLLDMSAERWKCRMRIARHLVRLRTWVGLVSPCPHSN